jgi:D-xylose transport system substrate-binding protein
MKRLFTRTRLSALLGAILIIMLLAACGNDSGGTTTNPTAPKNGKDCTQIGVLLPETASSARWDGKDKPELSKRIKEVTGKDVDYYNAEGDATKQETQADAALTKGDCILVVAPKNASTSAAIVAKAKARGVPVIAYDRLIQSKDLNYYVSFDGVKVGEIQGQYIADHYADYTKTANNLAMINGSEDDNNALLFKQGAVSKLQPLIDGGKLKKVYDQFTPAWDNDKARTEMDAVLTSQNNNIQIAYVANDGMANSVIAALKAKQLNGKVLVTGQDATVAGIQNILTGDQAMTVYKAIAKEAQATADLIKALKNGTDPASLTKGITTKTSDGGNVPSILELPVAVDKTNILTTVVADGYVTKAEICANLPAGTGNVC